MPRQYWKLPYSKEINAALKSCGGLSDFRKWEPILRNWRDFDHGQAVQKTTLITEGIAILRAEEQFVEQMLRQAERVTLLVPEGLVDREGNAICSREIECWACNATVLFSEVPNKLLERGDAPMAIGWGWIGPQQHYIVSLRSKGNFDVSAIAKRFGGGGHLNSAGFKCKELPWIRKEPELW
jgi:hypothetical protein